MSAVTPEMIDYMQKAGMPVSNEHSIRFTEVDPPRRLTYMEKVDFIPDVETYEVETVIHLEQVGDAVRMVLTFESMHDDHWTKLAVMGREGELVRLAKVLAARQWCLSPPVHQGARRARQRCLLARAQRHQA